VPCSLRMLSRHCVGNHSKPQTIEKMLEDAPEVYPASRPRTRLNENSQRPTRSAAASTGRVYVGQAEDPVRRRLRAMGGGEPSERLRSVFVNEKDSELGRRAA